MAGNYEKSMYNQLMEVMARLDAVEKDHHFHLRKTRKAANHPILLMVEAKVIKKQVDKKDILARLLQKVISKRN